MRFLAVTSPAYLEARTAPLSPADLAHHQCIRFRLRSGRIYRWEFAKHGEEIAIDVPGTLILDCHSMMIEAAVAGMGIAYVPESVARRHLDDGSLVTVIEDWCPYLPGLHLYYPGHRHIPPALRALIDTMRSMRP
jgi:DNA-binding transcriptional LysR family regulator